MILRRFSVLALLVASVSSGCGGEDPKRLVEGRWEGAEGAFIDIRADGTAVGNDGCNDVGVDWTPVSDAAGFFRVREATEMGCADVVGWSDASSYSLTGDTLVIESGDGDDLTTMTRQ